MRDRNDTGLACIYPGLKAVFTHACILLWSGQETFGHPMRPFIAVLSAGLLCSGCALTTAQIDVPYQPASQASAIPGANADTVSVATTDARTTYRDRVSTKKNGYGMEMAAIVPTTDLPSSLSDAFKQELTARGFRVGAGGSVVDIQLVRFYSDFKTGFFSGDALATVAYNIKVTAPNGTNAFSKYYEGTGTQPNVQIMGADNARAALIKAYTASVASAVNDPDFLAALQKGGAGAPAS